MKGQAYARAPAAALLTLLPRSYCNTHVEWQVPNSSRIPLAFTLFWMCAMLSLGLSSFHPSLRCSWTSSAGCACRRCRSRAETDAATHEQKQTLPGTGAPKKPWMP